MRREDPIDEERRRRGLIDADEIRHEIERGHILRFLQVSGLRPVTLRMLLYYLRDRRYPLTFEGLDFHLRYMRDKGWVVLEIPEPAIGEKEKIETARITAAGVDEIDGRKPGEPGVKF
jgi:hypothetical protein